MPSEGSSLINFEEDIKKLIKFYEDDVQCSDVVPIGELHLWYESVKDLKISQSQAINFYLACNKDIFPIIGVLLKILVTLPVSTCTSEMSFSTL